MGRSYSSLAFLMGFFLRTCPFHACGKSDKKVGLHAVTLLTILAADPRGLTRTRDHDGAERVGKRCERSVAGELRNGLRRVRVDGILNA